MFNVIRPQPGPDCSRDYRSKEVVIELKKIFHGKCYLCENEVSDPVIEHFIPHEGDKIKEYDWNNLYYACHRCNSIKGTMQGLLDCCDSSADVSRAIKCLCPSVPEKDVIVEAQEASLKFQNTAKLLDKCYNENNTGIRGISREALHEKIFEYYCTFIKYRMILKNKDSLPSDKEKAVEHLKNMAEVSYPFSIFWKWHILSDSFLAGKANIK
jgi:uncharacterized protein (TIGR02646 family)